MCGIAGIVAAGGLHPDESERVPRMRDVIAHRGPDDAGLFVDGHAALGHRRLSIVDLAAGHQPLSNEDDSIWIVFNGEIYNHEDVRQRLEVARPSLPHAFRYRDDRPRLRAVGRRAASSICAACSRSRSGMRRAAGCCSRATAWASSRSTGRGPATGCCSDPRSRRSSRAGWSTPRANERALPELLEHALPVGHRDAVQGHSSSAARPHAGLRERRDHACASTGTCRRARAPGSRSTSGAERRASGSANGSRSRSASG